MSEILRGILHIARRFKLATAFNLIGLVVAIATCYLLMTQILYHTTYNRHIEDVNKLYRMETDWLYADWKFSDHTCRPFAEILGSMPQVESYSLFAIPLNEMNVFPFERGDSTIFMPYTVGNNTAINTLTSRKVDGDISWTDSDQDGYIIPKSKAIEYFGTPYAADSDFIYHDVDTKELRKLHVRGVYEDFPENSELLNYVYGNLRDYYSTKEDAFSFDLKCIVKFKTVPEDLDAFSAKLKQAIVDSVVQKHELYFSDERDFMDSQKRISETAIKFTPLKYSYFEHSTYNTTGEKGYLSMLVILELACLIVAIIAAINFLNFTLAESPMRVRNLNTRRVLGAARGTLRLRMVAECVVTSVFASLVALAICHFLSLWPWASQMFVGSISLADHWLLAISLIAVAAMIGVAAGTYPARFATSFPLAMAVNGNFGLTPQGMHLRTALVCLQLTISLLMVIYIGILIVQSLFIFSSSYGYDKDRILVTELPPYSFSKDTLRQELTQLEGIDGISFSKRILGQDDGGETLWSSYNDKPFRYNSITTDSIFPQTLGIKIIEGRDFNNSDSATIIMNKSARDEWKWVKLGHTNISISAQPGDSAIVVGVCENFRYGTTRISNQKPFLIILNKADPELYSLNVRLNPDANRDSIKAQAARVLKKHFNNIELELTDFNKTLSGTSYDNEFRFFNQTYFISIICLIITLIGVFCLTMFETEYRRKEIGIRKVAGATSGEIIMMFCRHYIKLLLISFVIAAPLAYIFGNLTLEHFAQRAPTRWWLWVFPLGLAIVGAVTLTTVVLQSWRTARENPVNSIRTE